MKTCKVAALAASISLALGSAVALAAAPAALQLPGQGAVDAHSPGTATGNFDSTNGTATINIVGNAVIDWGVGAANSDPTLNPTGVPGFNIGAGGVVNFTGPGAVLNIDVSGNASQIYGNLGATPGSGPINVFVANGNGIVVGPHAAISSLGAVGLIANDLIASTVGSFNGTVSGAVGSTVAYDGAGGNVTVMPGGLVGNGVTTSVLISGGGMVNVDLTNVYEGATVAAGIPSSAVQVPHANAGASLVVSGDGEAIFQSAGNGASSGTVLADAGTTVAGQFTNTGTMTLEGGFDSAGELVNQSGTLTAGGNVSVGSFSNSGLYTGNGHDLTTTNGGLTNTGQMASVGALSVTGDLLNAGELTTSGDVSTYGGGLNNRGKLVVGRNLTVVGGNLVNQGDLAVSQSFGDAGVTVVNGSIDNAGQLTYFSDVGSGGAPAYLITESDSSLPSFTDGASYSITNSGTITGGGSSPAAGGGNPYLIIKANVYQFDASAPFTQNDDITAQGMGPGGLSPNGSTGSFTNTGALQLGPAGTPAWLTLEASGSIALGGALQYNDGTQPAGTEADPGFGHVSALANEVTTSSDSHLQIAGGDGAVSVTTPIVAGAGSVHFAGNQVAVHSDVLGSSVTIQGGDKPANYTGHDPATDYAIRIAKGVTVAGNEVELLGAAPGDNPNVILQGTLAGSLVGFQGSDFYSGPSGQIDVSGIFGMEFTGKIKTAPYLNDPDNFRYNYLPVVNTGTAPLLMVLAPAAYTTNGTDNNKSAVNILVDGDVTFAPSLFFHPTTPVINGSGTAVTGVVDVPNTHLVLQSTGNIATAGDVYWPGLVYFGTIGATPGSLGLGTITLGGDFSNVLPGNVDGRDGIHFETQLPLTLGGTVTTNVNAWFNFGNDVLTQLYTAGQGATGPFYSGAQGPGAVVNYAPTPASGFHTQAPNPTK